MATHAYVLLAEEEYENVKNAGTLSAHNVGACAGSKNGFPIFFDPGIACLRARKTYLAGQHVALAPHSQSIWKLLMLHFTDSQWVAHLLPQNGEPPLFSVTTEYVSVQSDLCLEGISVSIDTYAMWGHTVEEWATARLHKRRQVTNENCGQCGNLEPVAWRGSLGNHLRHKTPEDDDKPKAYCAACWDAYFTSKK